MAARSEHSFQLLLSGQSIPDEVKQKIAMAGIITMEQLAFLSKGPAGQASGPEFEATVLMPLAGETTGKVAADLRMLYLKCYSQTFHELRVQVESKEGEGRQVPSNEKALRMRKLAEEMPGLQIE
eukprot:6475806-Amphidinium_carterae.1